MDDHKPESEGGGRIGLGALAHIACCGLPLLVLAILSGALNGVALWLAEGWTIWLALGGVAVTAMVMRRRIGFGARTSSIWAASNEASNPREMRTRHMVDRNWRS